NVHLIRVRLRLYLRFIGKIPIGIFIRLRTMIFVEVHPLLDMWLLTATLRQSLVHHLLHILVAMLGQWVFEENMATSTMLGGVRFLVEEWSLRVIIGIIGMLVSRIGGHLVRVVLLDVGCDLLRAGRAPHFRLIDVRAVVRPTDAAVGVGLNTLGHLGVCVGLRARLLLVVVLGVAERRCLMGSDLLTCSDVVDIYTVYRLG